MASIDSGGDHDGGGKNKQKKVSLHVDFTPMVDMNMLLITFFMFCTSLSKPKTMEINMPSKDKVSIEEQTKVKESEAITIILGENDRLFYYEGLLEEDKFTDPTFLKESDYSPEGVRKLLLSRNAVATNEMMALKVRKINNEVSEEDFRKQSIEIKGAKGTPTVMIKATDKSTYKNLIAALDEVQIANIGKYAIVDMTEADQFLIDMLDGVVPQAETVE